MCVFVTETENTEVQREGEQKRKKKVVPAYTTNQKF